jgi:hypothetical protein
VSQTYHFALENGTGSLLMENSGYLILEAQPAAPPRVQATVAGFYRGDYKDIGDVFDLLSWSDLSDSTASFVPIGNPDYPVYGWMLVVPSTTALFSWAAYGNSSPRNSPRRTVL